MDQVPSKESAENSGRDETGDVDNAMMEYVDDILDDETLQKEPSKEPKQRRSSSAIMISQPTPPGADLEEGSGKAIRRLEILVPPVNEGEEYITDDRDIEVTGVIKQIQQPRKRPHYLTRTKDGRKSTISFNDLVQLPGGLEALEIFDNQLEPQAGRQESLDTRTTMVSERSLRSKRQKPAGFVDFSQVDLSDSDEDKLDGSAPALQRPVRKRGLLSAPRPAWKGKSRRSQDSDEKPFSSSEQSDSDQPRRRRIRLVVKEKRRPGRPSKTVVPSDNSSLEDYASDTSAFQPRGSKRKRGKEAEAALARRSGRSKRQVGSMRELGEDDIPEIATRNSSGGPPKAVGAKEFFPSLAKSDEFRLRHRQTCDACDTPGDNSERGQLIFCQGCTFSYHHSCLGPRNTREHLVTKVGHQNFVLQCRRCVESIVKKEFTAPRQSKCQVCHESGKSCHPFRDRKTSREEQKEREDNQGEDPTTAVPEALLGNIASVLFRCVHCYRAFHMHHLPPRTDRGAFIDEEQSQAADDRFAEYCRDWTCLDCSAMPARIGALIAWRPIDANTYLEGLSTEEVPEDDKEYLIKWENKSFYRSTWKSGAWVWGTTVVAMRNAFTKRDNGLNLPKMRAEDAIPEDYLRVDIVFDVKYSNVVSTRTLEIDKKRVKEVASALVKFKGLGYEDVVWEEPPDSQDVERWNDFRIAYDNWVLGHYVAPPSQRDLDLKLKQMRMRKFGSKDEMKEQPKSLTGGTLMDYQIEGMNWLLFQWHRGQNAILADEMGLGKTIQIIAFLTTLQHKHGCWPFLIVVPNSTCANWRREIKQWAPSLRVVSYFGSKDARDLAYKYELFPNKSTELKCHVVVTSYDAAQDQECQRFFKRIKWTALVVDEGQRLKNDKSILYHALSALKAPFKVLLTGTPLQNNTRELFNLLQFLDPSVEAQTLEDRYAELSTNKLSEIHEIIRPFFLRRTKAQVLTNLPPMAQIIVPLSMSTLQKQLSKSIYARNADLIKSLFGGNKKSTVHGLRSTFMQIRKCLCHPFVYNADVEEGRSNDTVSHRRLVEAGSKLQLLEIMLPKLKERGHRVLIFSQFLDSLTIMEDFLSGLDLEHLRLDGTNGSSEKQKLIDRFNAPDSSVFAFLLSTRAGGVGINLATADTVIILDPDFNPQQDIQAISRAHRIGQKKKVLVFQLMTRNSPEEEIMRRSKKKLALDHVLIDRMEADEADGTDLESALRFGAEALFSNDEEKDSIHYDSASVDKLLDRSQVENTRTGKDDSAESSFSFARIWANDTSTLEESLGDIPSADPGKRDSTLWDKILQERAKQAAEEKAMKAQTFGRGKRQRQNVDYSHEPTVGVGQDEQTNRKGRYVDTDSDTDFQEPRGESDGDESAAEAVAVEVVDLAELDPSPARRPSKTMPVLELKNAIPFRRTAVRAPDPMPAITNEGKLPCLSCNFKYGRHAVGRCPLKVAGVEHCNLCGIAHYGIGNTCPHLGSETQINIMLRDLKSSPESKELIDRAVQFLKGRKGNLVHKKKEQQRKEAALRTDLNGAKKQPFAGSYIGDQIQERLTPPAFEHVRREPDRPHMLNAHGMTPSQAFAAETAPKNGYAPIPQPMTGQNRSTGTSSHGSMGNVEHESHAHPSRGSALGTRNESSQWSSTHTGGTTPRPPPQYVVLSEDDKY